MGDEFDDLKPIPRPTEEELAFLEPLRRAEQAMNFGIDPELLETTRHAPAFGHMPMLFSEWIPDDYARILHYQLRSHQRYRRRQKRDRLKWDQGRYEWQRREHAAFLRTCRTVWRHDLLRQFYAQIWDIHRLARWVERCWLVHYNTRNTGSVGLIFDCLRMDRGANMRRASDLANATTQDGDT